MRRRIQTAKVQRIDLDVALQPIEVEPRFDEVLLVVLSRGRAIGQVTLPALSVIPVDLQRAMIGRELGEALWRQELEHRFLEAVGAEEDPERRPQLSVSVIVCTRDRPEDLERCLASLFRLDPAPHEIVVVDNCPTTDATRALCRGLPVRYLHEAVPGQSRARNRGIAEATGEIVAFTDDDCVVEPGWLSGLAREFADQRVMAVTGVVAPIELETPSQYLFEAHGGFQRGFERRDLDGVVVDPATAAGTAGAGANAAFRRRVFDQVEPFAEWLGPGTPARAADDNDVFCRILAAGHSIVYDPGQLVWHRHRRDLRGLHDVLFDYGVSSSAFAAQRLVFDRDPSGLRIVGWWWLHHFPAEIRDALRRRPNRVPFRYVLAEMRGTLVGPWRLWRSRRSRRAIEPIVPEKRGSRIPEQLVALGAESPSLSVVIPSAGRRQMLEQVLAGLGRQCYPVERFETVVVLDGATDDSAEMLASVDVPFRLRVLELAKGGVGAARNAGVRAAGEPVIHFLDDDIVPEPGCLAAHAAAHQERGGGRVALGYCPPVPDGGWWGQMACAWWEDHYRRKGEPGHCWSHVDFTTGNSSLARELLLELGGFDEQFRVRHEDWELAVRLLERGVTFGYYPSTLAWHHLDLRLATAVERQRREGSDDVVLARLHPEIGVQLPLASYGGGRPPVADDRLERGLATADRLERRGRRGAWARHTRTLLRDAYVSGLRDEIPSEEAFQGLLADLTARPPAKVPVSLDGGAMSVVPWDRSIELALEVGARTVARVPGSGPGVPLEWALVAERVRRRASSAVRVALVEEELARAGRVTHDGLELARVR